jgi:hypothetical protein
MKISVPEINLTMAWMGVVCGIAMGMWLGMNFQRPDWLGGYGSLRRRLYRLGHISFFGLAMLNLMFYLTMVSLQGTGPTIQMAAWGFGIGALTMPICCFLMAHVPKCRLLFAVPVVSLLGGSLITLWEVLQS